MANRRQLLFLAGGLAVWVGAFRLVPQIAGQLDGIEFIPLEQVPGFRTISSTARASSPGSGSFDFLAGLTPVEPLPAGLMQQVKAAPERYLFKDMNVGSNTTPVAYFFDYFCPYCRVLSAHLTELAAASEIVVMRQHWPIFGEASLLAARASLAAAMQGDTDKLHGRLLRTPGQVTPQFLRRIAGDVGLSWSRMEQDMQAPAVTASLDRARALARLFSFIGTPSLVVGRTVAEGEISQSRLLDLARLERSGR